MTLSSGAGSVAQCGASSMTDSVFVGAIEWLGILQIHLVCSLGDHRGGGGPQRPGNDLKVGEGGGGKRLPG